MLQIKLNLMCSPHSFANAYKTWNRVAQIYHARMRMHCCTLNDFNYRCNLTASPSCACGAERETVSHFLLNCPLYHSTRLEIFGSFDSDFDVNCLLYGKQDRDSTYNKQLFNNVELFILKSKRFS